MARLRDPFASVLLTALFVLVGSAPAAGQEGGPFARFPALSPDGQTVAFSWQGDIWTVPVEGGTAYRLTVHEAYESHPRWSPDGSRIVFVTDRYGSDDLFVVGSRGESPRRLTHHSAPDGPASWMPDGRILFETDRTWQQVEREEEIYTVSAEGGTPDRLLDAVGYTPVTSPDGRFIAFSYGSNDPMRKGYRGPADKDLWIYDTEDGSYTQLTTFEGNDQLPRWADDRTLFFVSERDGAYNLWRMALSDDGARAGEPTQVTNFVADGVRHFDVGMGGDRVVIERLTDLYVMEPPAPAQRLEITVPGDVRFPAVERRTFTSQAGEYAVSPSGDYVAFVVRGEIFLTENGDEGNRTVRLTDHAWRDRDVAWLSDSTLIFASDRDGDYDLYRLESADADEPDLFLTLKHRVVPLTDTDVEERAPVVSNARDRVAFQRGRGDLIVAELDDGELGRERVLLDGWAGPDDVAWSPDDRYLAYALPDLDFNAEVYIHPVDGSREPVNVTQHPKGDGDPVWSRDGSKLAFLSQRNNGDSDVWFVWLREADWEKTQLDWELEEDLREDEEDPDTAVAPVEIDFEEIHERLTQVTSLPANESDLAISHDGEWLYFVSNRSGRQRFDADQDLHKVKWDGSEMEALTQGGQSPYGVTLGPKGTHLYMMRSGGRIARVQASNGSMDNISFSARMDIEFRQEAEQVFSEAWRILNDGFYDPDFHGQDWQALRDKYLPWALEASTRQDFRDVFNWMLGELNASHLGLYGSDRAETERERTGLLGVEIDPVDDGVRVERVVPKSPADREFSRLYAGDVIVAVDGESAAEGNFYRLLTDRVNDRVVLTVRGEDGEREVVIRPTGGLYGELYDEWVEDRKALTEAYSDGRLGYIHIQGMNWPSFERFERELVAAGEGKDGLVIDVRYNGGGWTTDYLMAVLTVRQHAYTVPRGATEDLENTHSQFSAHYPFGERLPLAAWTRPSVALCNANSFSNAEIFSHAYKHLDIGTLVGTPTFGAVISTGGAGLIDGSFVRLPFRGWYVKATGENMENGPAVPDVIVDVGPNAREDGEDAQLRRAVEVLLSEIEGQ